MATASGTGDSSVQEDSMDGSQPTRPSRVSLTYAQEAFAQTKTKELYVKTCCYLQPHKSLVDTFQETILWHQPLLSVLLYASVHFAFWYLYFTNASFLTLSADMVFWLLLADAFWVVANRHKLDEAKAPRSRIGLSRKVTQGVPLMSFEEAYIAAHCKPSIGELAPLEVLCLWLAEALMWGYSFKLAIKHWNAAQPIILGFLIVGVGIACVCVGYFISAVTIAYFLIMISLLYPVVIYYDLVIRISLFMDNNYPIFATKVQQLKLRLERLVESFKKLLKPPPDSEFQDFQLFPNGNDHQGHPPPAHGGMAAGAVPNGQGTPSAPYQSITLTPFGSLPTHIDPLDSLASLTPQPEGFQSITSFLGNSPAPPPSRKQLSNPPNLESISESDSSEGVTNPGPEWRPRLNRAGTISLDPFPNGQDFLTDSFELEESGPSAMATRENYSHASSTADTGFETTTMSVTNPYQDPPGYVYEASDRPPPYSSGNSTSPLFSGRFDSPAVPGVKVTQPVGSSTPRDGDDSARQTNLRQRDVRRDSDT